MYPAKKQPKKPSASAIHLTTYDLRIVEVGVLLEDAGEDEIMESLETEYGFLVNGCVVTQAV